MKMYLLLFTTAVISGFSAAHASTFGTPGALMSTATNQLDSSWTPQWANLKAYYKLDGKLGAIANGATVPDLLGTSNGTASATGLNFVAGILEQGVSFNGSANISIPRTTPANVCSNMTVMVWVKWNATTSTSWATIAGNFNSASCTQAGWYLQQHDTAKNMEFTINTSAGTNQTTSTSVDVFDGSWRHVAFTIDSTQALIYIDGVLNVTFPISIGSGVCSPTAPVKVGGGMCDTALPSAATVDELAIFNAVLSAGEISTIYNRQKNGM